MIRALRLFSFCLSLLPLSTSSATAQLIAPTTTLAQESAYNTSSGPSFKKQPNGNAVGHISKLPVRSLLYPGSNTTVLSHVVTWFGDPSHMNVGYVSNDPNQIHSQVTDMISRGIDGVVLDWDGPQVALSTSTVSGFRTEAENQGNFTFAVMEDVSAVVTYAQQNGCDVTQKIIADLNYAYANFESSTAYMRANGRPVVFFFGTENYYIDWTQVRASVPGNPELIFETASAFTQPQSNGAFNWVYPNNSDPTDQGISNIDNFYAAARQNVSQFAIGSAYKGFNDTLADWSSDRIMSQQCGQTWLATFSEAAKYFSTSNQLRYLQLVTWNDYEEGTEIETGIDNCIALNASMQGSNLNWNVIGAGQENTLSTYRVWISSDDPNLPAASQNLTPLVDIAPGTHSVDLSQFPLGGATTYTLYVEAIGKSGILNHLSPAVTYRAGHLPPTASISVTPNVTMVPVPVNATVTASATGANVASISIDFGDGAVLSGPSASHQYASAGTYIVTATVFDSLRVSSRSQTTVTVNANPNFGVNIASPASGNINSQFVDVKATATTPNTPITAMIVYVDDALLYQSLSQSSIDATLKLNNGPHHIVVQAWDYTGTVFRSEVYINVLAPPSTLSAVLDVQPLPAIGKYGVMACTARSTDSNGFVTSSFIDFGDGSTTYGTTGLHNYASPGTYKVTTTLTDDFGYTSSSSSTISVPTGGGQQGCAPASAGVNLCSPTQGQSVADPVTVAASATPAPGDSIAAIRIYVDNLAQYTAVPTNNSISTALALPPGSRYIVAVAYANSGKVYTSAVTANVLGQQHGCAPSTAGVNLCSPSQGQTVSDPVTISASATPAPGEAIPAIRIYVDNLPQYTAAPSNNSISATLNLTTGSHYIVAVAYTNTGGAYTSAATVNVQ